jgi:hypothetical protein
LTVTLPPLAGTPLGVHGVDVNMGCSRCSLLLLLFPDQSKKQSKNHDCLQTEFPETKISLKFSFRKVSDVKHSIVGNIASLKKLIKSLTILNRHLPAWENYIRRAK